MNITLDGKAVRLTDSNAIIARNSVNSFVEVVKRGAEHSDNEALYLTTLIMMYKKSTELLSEYGAENIQYVMNHYYNKVAPK